MNYISFIELTKTLVEYLKKKHSMTVCSLTIGEDGKIYIVGSDAKLDSVRRLITPEEYFEAMQDMKITKFNLDCLFGRTTPYNFD